MPDRAEQNQMPYQALGHGLSFPDGRIFRDGRGSVSLTREEWECRLKAAAEFMASWKHA